MSKPKGKRKTVKAPDMDKLVAGEDIPRFVVTITDTQTVTGGQYFAISAGADSLADFNRLIPKSKRTNECRTELQNMFWHMQKGIEELDQKPWEPISEGEIVGETTDQPSKAQ